MKIPFILLLLHGSNKQHQESNTAFENFKKFMGAANIVTFYYRDSKGFPVWAIGTFARNGLTTDGLLVAWDRLLSAEGVTTAGTSYGKELPFYELVSADGDIILANLKPF